MKPCASKLEDERLEGGLRCDRKGRSHDLMSRYVRRNLRFRFRYVQTPTYLFLVGVDGLDVVHHGHEESEELFAEETFQVRRAEIGHQTLLLASLRVRCECIEQQAARAGRDRHVPASL